MKLTVLAARPKSCCSKRKSSRIKAEAENGWFGMLPKHVDFVTALVPGVMTFQPSRKTGRVSRDRSRNPGEMRRGSFRLDAQCRSRRRTWSN